MIKILSYTRCLVLREYYRLSIFVLGQFTNTGRQILGIKKGWCPHRCNFCPPWCRLTVLVKNQVFSSNSSKTLTE